MIDLEQLASTAARREDDKYRRKITHLWIRVGALNFMHGRFAERPLSFQSTLSKFTPAFTELFRHKYVNAKVTIDSGFEDPMHFDVSYNSISEFTEQEQDKVNRNLMFDIGDITQYLEERPQLWYTLHK